MSTGLAIPPLGTTAPRTRDGDASWMSSSPVTDRQASFAAVLGRARTDRTPSSKADQAREAAEQFVAVSLVQPVLAQLRSGGMAVEPFAPSSGERRMQALLDAHLADQIVKASGFDLVDRIADDLLRAAGAARSTARTMEDAWP